MRHTSAATPPVRGPERNGRSDGAQPPDEARAPAMQFFRQLDVLGKNKVDDSFLCQSLHGASLTVAASTLCLGLLLSQLYEFYSVQTLSTLEVQTALEDRISINFDISFPAIPCALISVHVKVRTACTQSAPAQVTSYRLVCVREGCHWRVRSRYILRRCDKVSTRSERYCAGGGARGLVCHKCRTFPTLLVTSAASRELIPSTLLVCAS
eukprot:scaffold5221_cov397-Prasinococcus_capsulatus_cf.AAC.13